MKDHAPTIILTDDTAKEHTIEFNSKRGNILRGFCNYRSTPDHSFVKINISMYTTLYEKYHKDTVQKKDYRLRIHFDSAYTGDKDGKFVFTDKGGQKHTFENIKEGNHTVDMYTSDPTIRAIEFMRADGMVQESGMLEAEKKFEKVSNMNYEEAGVRE